MFYYKKKGGVQMGVGSNLKKVLADRHMSIKDLAEKTKIPVNTLYSITQRDSKRVQGDILQKIASALGISVGQLLGFPEREKVSQFWSADLEEKLRQVGCSIGAYEEDAYLWINYPDGTLEVTEDELKELNESTNAFMRFKLDELRQSRKEQFRPANKKKPPAPAGDS